VLSKKGGGRCLWVAFSTESDRLKGPVTWTSLGRGLQRSRLVSPPWKHASDPSHPPDKLVNRTLPGSQPIHPSQIMIFPICGDHARHPYRELWVSALRHRTMMNGYHGVKDKVRNKQPPPRERANELLSLYSSFLSETVRLMSPVLGRWDRLPLERVLELVLSVKCFPSHDPSLQFTSQFASPLWIVGPSKMTCIHPTQTWRLGLENPDGLEISIASGDRRA